MPTDQSYDVFLSHNSTDNPAVEELARRLAQEGIQPWLDKWNLIPGEPWQEAIESALERCTACAVFIGPSGTGPWQNEEMRAAISRRVSESQGRFRVIPILLPGAEREERSSLPTFLAATTWVEFRGTLDDEPALHRLVCGIRGIAPGPDPGQAIYEGVCPYRGLQVFDVQHAPFFFGREALIGWLLNELRPSTSTRPSNRFLAIIGPSGSGKSSLARAGLVAALQRGELEGSAEWPIAICRPGMDPLESLVTALCGITDIGQTPSAVLDLMRDLSDDERALHLTTRLALCDAPPKRRLVLLVDQFEEVFTLCHDELRRQALIDNLLYAASVTGGQTVVLFTLRADFYGKCAAYPSLAAALSDHQVLVGPMTDEELQEAIERPAQLVGCEFEPGLVEMLLRDVRDQPGSLPLLQHALLELWNRRQGRRLTHAAYQAIGGVAGALERRAEAVYEDFSETEKASCRRVFLRLTQPGESTEDTKRRVPSHELLSAAGEHETVEAVVRTLADARLVTTEGSEDSREEQFVEVAHEALIRGWSRLREWIDENRAALRLHRHLTEAANEWEQHGREESYLYRGTRLAAVEKAIPAADLSALEAAFVRASAVARQAERRARRWRLVLRASVVGLVLLLLASVGGVLWLWNQYTTSTTPAWQPVAGFPDDPVTALAVAGGSPPTYYVGTASIGVGRSQDGVTWTMCRQGLPTDEEVGGDSWKNVRGIMRLAVDRLASKHVFASVIESGIYKSHNGGDTWQAANDGLPDGYVIALAVNGNLVLAVFDQSAECNLYASLDDGMNWRLVEGQGKNPLDQVHAVSIAPDGETVYVGTEDGLYRSPVGPPWIWEQIAELDTVGIIVPEAGGDQGLYVAAKTPQGQGSVYRWRPGEPLQSLASTDMPLSALAPHPSPEAFIATYALLADGRVLAVTHDGQTLLLEQHPGWTYALLTGPHPMDGEAWLLLGHLGGLMEYQGTRDQAP